MRSIIFVVVLLLATYNHAQELSGPELLDKAIAYHDPNTTWNTFKGSFEVRMETPNSSDRVSTIQMNLPQSTFELQVTKDGDAYTYKLDGADCEISLNGSTAISEEDLEKFRLSCDRGTMYRNYYTYLYGLPMKLK
ncbi:MAG: DUF6503 family protein, partial [Kangiellaceae bacterium]|nr:DUF6503 family protein [Kangiellaceae bacterium]